MMTRKFRVSTLLFLILIFSFNNTNVFANNGSNANTCDGDYSTFSTINLSIKEAYYTDLDNDGNEDDVYSRVMFKLKTNNIIDGIEPKTSGVAHTNVRCDDVYYYLAVTLTLPSGYTFQHKLYRVTQNYVFDLEFIMINHAIEEGWYELRVDVATSDMMNVEEMASTVLIFDPPGGRGGGGATFSAL